MKMKEIREQNEGEIVKRVSFLKKELFDMRQQGRLGQVEKPARFQMIRREIARLLTVANERKLSHGKKN